jgi:branched-chain amino acid transport system substrate-binding protein
MKRNLSSLLETIVSAGVKLAMSFALMIGALITISVATGSETSAGASSTPVNIGFVCDCADGTLSSSDSVAKPTVQAWVSYTNAHGGVNGHKVNVIYEDPNFNSGTALSEVETLVSQDHVVAIIDVSSSDNVWGSYAASHGVPIVGGNTSSETFVTNSDFFSVGQTLDSYPTNFVDAAKKVGATSMGVLYCAEAVTCEQTVPAIKTTAQQLKVSLTYESAISASSPNFTAPCVAAQQAGTQALVVADAVSVVQKVAQSCSTQNYNPYYIALDGAVSESFTSTPGIDTKLIGSETDYPFFLNSIPASKTMISAIRKYQPSLISNPNYSELVTQAWASGLLFSAAATASNAGKSGAITPGQIKTGLYALHATTLGGMTPPLTFHKGSPTPIDCWYWIRIQNKKFTAPYGIKPVCVKPVALSS